MGTRSRPLWEIRLLAPSISQEDQEVENGTQEYPELKTQHTDPLSDAIPHMRPMHHHFLASSTSERSVSHFLELSTAGRARGAEKLGPRSHLGVLLGSRDN